MPKCDINAASNTKQKLPQELSDMILISLNNMIIASKLKCWYSFRKIIQQMITVNHQFNYSRYPDEIVIFQYEICKNGDLETIKQMDKMVIPFYNAMIEKAITNNQPFVVEYLKKNIPIFRNLMNLGMESKNAFIRSLFCSRLIN
jgi:hypothetical protein